MGERNGPGVVVLAAVVVAVAVLGVVAIVGSDEEAAVALGGGGGLAGGDAGAADVHVDVRVEGPLSQVLTAEVSEGPVGHAVVGHGLQVGGVVIELVALGSDVVLPPNGRGGAWAAEADGLRVSVGSPRAVQVVTGGPAGTSGTVIEPRSVPAWLPRTASLEILSVDLLDVLRPRSVAVPMGPDDTLLVAVTFEPSTRRSTPPQAPADAAGTRVPVPQGGTAVSLMGGDGVPLWVASTGYAGVTVVDGRSPFAVNGLRVLTRWCPSSQGFLEVYGGSRFLPDGTFTFGPANRGLVTYAATVGSDGTVTIGAGRPGAPPPPPREWPPATEWVPEPPPEPGVAGPHCDGDDRHADHRPDLSAHPVTTVADVAGHDGRWRVHGRFELTTAGLGWLCMPTTSTMGCDGDGVPVDLSDAAARRPEDRDVASVYDVDAVVTVVEGSVVEAWIDEYVVPIVPTQPTAPRSVLTRIRDVRVDPAECRAIYPVQARCAVVADIELLRAVRPGEPTMTGDLASVPADGLPPGWVVVDEHFGDGDALTVTPLSTADLPDGRSLADVPADQLVILTVEGNSPVDVVEIEASD